MNIEQLKTAILRKPFRAVKISLGSGESVVARHPENIAFGRDIVLVAHQDEFDYTLFEPEQVSAISYFRAGRSKSR